MTRNCSKEIATLKIHPVTNCYPLMVPDEMAELISDIRERGLLFPVTIQGDTLLDGRNRMEACRVAGVELRTVEYDGDDPVGFIISTNKRRNLDQSQRAMVAAKIANLGEGRPKETASKEAFISQPAAARVLGVSRASVQRARAVLDAAPELAEEVAQGKLKVSAAEKMVRERRREAERQAAVANISEAAKLELAQVCDIRHCSMAELFDSGISPDCIITDPPYAEEYLHLYGELAGCAKDVPLVAVMCGQTYLPEVLARMCAFLKYRWTLAYLTPGGQSAQQWPCKINSFWKPVLLFGEAVDWIGDVARSGINDSDKRFHEWGQSESGIGDLVERLSKPGQLVCDPFLGAGTTAVVSLKLGRRFVGCDIDAQAVRIALERCRA